METKRCTKCGEEKPITGFCRDRHSPDGRCARCKSCKDTAERKHRAKLCARDNIVVPVEKVCPGCKQLLPESAFFRSRNRRDGLHSYCHACDRDRQLRHHYGIGSAEFDAMFRAQGQACAICGISAPGGRGQWHVDHNHATGEVRGILCHSCNTVLGHMRENPVLFAAAVVYLSQHQVVVHAKPTQELRPVA